MAATPRPVKIKPPVKGGAKPLPKMPTPVKAMPVRGPMPTKIKAL